MRKHFKRAPIPLFGRLVRCSAHGGSLVRLWYVSSSLDAGMWLSYQMSSSRVKLVTSLIPKPCTWSGYEVRLTLSFLSRKRTSSMPISLAPLMFVTSAARIICDRNKILVTRSKSSERLKHCRLQPRLRNYTYGPNNSEYLWTTNWLLIHTTSRLIGLAPL